MADAVDAITAQWNRERPDLDVWPMGVVGRINRLSRLLDKELKNLRRGATEDDIEGTTFKVVPRGGGYEPVVVDQKLRRR